MLTQNRTVLLAALLALPLAGCGAGDDVARTIGLVRDVPDEFTVTTRAPLSMPPDYTLRPPEPGASRPQEQTPRQAAEATLAPQSTLAGNAAMSPGQQALLAATGPAAPADIRAQVDRSAALESGKRSLTDRLLFWKQTPEPGTVVDAQKESQRLRGNAALGQSPATGDTPIIERNPSNGLLGRVF